MGISSSAEALEYPAAAWPNDFVSLTRMPGGADRILILGAPGAPDGHFGQARGVSLPFGFRFFDSDPYDTFNVGAKGYISFGNDEVVHSAARFGANYLLSPLNPRNLIAAWWGDHFCDPLTSVKTKLVGAAPDRAFIIEWDGCSKRSGTSGRSGTTFEAQIWLHEGSNFIRIKYGKVQVEAGEPWPMVAWGLKPQAGAGSLGPDREGRLEVCDPQGPVGGTPACDALLHFPHGSTIQYGLSSGVDLIPYVSYTDLEVGASNLEVDVQALVQNMGASALSSSLPLEVYLSESGSLDAGSIKLFDADVPSTLHMLVGGGSYSLTTHLRAERPPNGSYSLCVLVPLPVGAEDDRSNNWRCASELIHLGPDLTGSITAPAVGEPSASVSIPIKLENLGTEDAGFFRYRVTMVPQDSELPIEDLLLGSLDALPRGESVSLMLTAQLPAIIRASSYYFRLDIDVERQVPESNRINNLILSERTMSNKTPLVMISPALSWVELPDGCYFGEGVEAEMELCNLGTAEASGFFPGILLGRNSQLNFHLDARAAAFPELCSNIDPTEVDSCVPEGDSICASGFCSRRCSTDSDCGSALLCRNDPLIAAQAGLPEAKVCVNHLSYQQFPRENRCRRYQLKGTIPEEDARGVPHEAGWYQFHLLSDVGNRLSQSVPDQHSSGALYCQPGRADLIPVELLPHSRFVVGKSASLSRTIRNLGMISGRTEDADRFRYQYFLSSSRLSSTLQIPLAVVSTGGLGQATIQRKGEDRRTERVLIPPGLQPGSYFLGIIVDPLDELPELSKSNNVLIHSWAIQVEEGALRITTDALPRVNKGAFFAFSFVAVGQTGESRWSANDLPSSLSFSEEGQLSGVPTEAGIFEFRVRVNAEGLEDERLVALQVLERPSSLEIADSPLPLAIRGALYGGSDEGFRLTANGGAAPYHWDLDPEVPENLLPRGLEMQGATGRISGRPTQNAEDGSFVIRVTDALGNQVSMDMTISVVSAPPVSLSALEFPLATTGREFDRCIEAIGGVGNFRWSYDGDSIPTGLDAIVEGERFCLRGAPAACGSYLLNLHVEDAQGAGYHAPVFLPIDCGKLLLDTRELRSVDRGESISFQLRVGPSTDPVFRLHAGVLPGGLSLGPDGQITGTVDGDASYGVHNSIVEVRDSQGRLGLGAITVAVNLPDRAPPMARKEPSGCSTTAGARSLLAPISILLFGFYVRRRSASRRDSHDR